MAGKSKEAKPKAPKARVRPPKPERKALAPTLAGKSPIARAALPERHSPILRARAMDTLQKSVGNVRVDRMVGDATKPQCAPLKVSSPSDPAEREAVGTAQKIMRMPAPAAPPTIARAADSKTVHRKEQGHAPSSVSSEIASSQSGGAPLEAGVRGFMEPRFGASFEKVRVHADERAARLNRQVGARAFAVGQQIFFGRGQYRPESHDGRELIAHELTHTIQQGAAIQRAPEKSVQEKAPAQVQRWGLSDALGYFADKANLIPGFRMFTIVLGVNPINMSPVDRSPANILRAAVEILPLGTVISQALDSYGVFEKAGAWISQQIATLGMVGGAIRGAIDRFLDTLSWSDVLDLGGVWNRAKAILTEPIDRMLSFIKGLAVGILELIKDAILKPLAVLASKTRGWDLLTAVLGRNPITGEAVPRTPEVLIGGFMKLIGQEDVWENAKKANAIPRLWAWFQGALAGLIGFVQQVPALFIQALKSLTVTDIIVLPMALAKVAGAFGDFLGRFLTWAGETVWKLLELIFEVVSPPTLVYLKKTGGALKSILKNPLPFVGNLVKAAKLGFQNFGSNFLEHLKAGLIGWLTGSLPGVYIPKAFALGELVKFVFSVLGISWANVRAKLVKAIGETPVKIMEEGFAIVKTLVTDGPAAAWEQIQTQLTNLKDMVIGGITDFVVDTVVKKAIPKLISMFIPGAGFISAIISIYDTVMVFVNKISQIIQVVTAFIDSIVAIAAGQIGPAAARVEKILAGLLSLAINFLAGFVGLGKVADKVMGVVNKVRATIDKALDKLIEWIVTSAKKLFAKAFSKDKKDDRTPAQKQADLDKAIAEAEALQDDPKATDESVRKGLLGIKSKYKLTSLELVVDADSESEETAHVVGEVNPKKNSKKHKFNKDGTVGSLGITRKQLTWEADTIKKFLGDKLWKKLGAVVGDFQGAGIDIRHKVSISDTIKHTNDSIAPKKVSVAVAMLTAKGFPPEKSKGAYKKADIVEAARKLLQKANNDPTNLILGEASGNRRLGSRYDTMGRGTGDHTRHDAQKGDFIEQWGFKDEEFTVTIERKSKKRGTDDESETWVATGSRDKK